MEPPPESTSRSRTAALLAWSSASTNRAVNSTSAVLEDGPLFRLDVESTAGVVLCRGSWVSAGAPVSVCT